MSRRTTRRKSAAPAIARVLDEVNLVVFQTRIVTPIRDTGEGEVKGSRIEKVLQACFDPKLLRPLNAKKQEANRICRNYGTKVETLNAWAVPRGQTQDLLDDLAKIAAGWSTLAEDLAASIGSAVNLWASDNPSESEAIRKLAPSADEVREATRFIYTSFRIDAKNVDDTGCLEADLSGLAGQTMREFALALRDSSLDKNSGEKYTQGVREVLARLAKKAASMAFLDPRIEEVAEVLASTLALLPLTGPITNAHAVLVKSVVDQMLDHRRLYRNGFAKPAEENSADEADSGPTSAEPAKTPPPKVDYAAAALAW